MYFTCPDVTITAMYSSTAYGGILIDTTSFGNGSATGPSMYFVNDPDTGIYRSTTNELSVTAGGTKMLSVNTTGVSVSGALSATGTGNVDFSGTSGTFNASSGRNIMNGIFIHSINSVLTSTTTIDTTSIGTKTFIPLSSSTAFTVTLPTTTSNNGLEYFFVNSGAGIVTITTSTGAQTFDGGSVTSYPMNQNDRLHIICYGDYWYTF